MKKLFCARMTAAVVLFVGLFGTSVFTQAATLVVDQTGQGDFFFIEDALEAAQPGDTVHVNPGSYNEENIVITKNITLQGSGYTETIIRDSLQYAGINVASPEGATIKNLRVTADRVGIEIDNYPELHSNEPIIGNVTIDNCLITECGNAGIRYWEQGHLTISRTIISNNGDDQFNDYHSGIVFSGNADPGESTLLLENSLIVSNRNFGIWMVGADNGGGPNSVEIVNCVIANNGEQAYSATWLSAVSAMKNTIIANDNIGENFDDSIDLIASHSLIWNGNVLESISFDVLDQNILDEDPLFNDDWTLRSNSPAIDAGEPFPFANDQDGTRNDMGAFGGPLGGPNPDEGAPIFPNQPTATPTPQPTATPAPQPTATPTPQPTATPTPTPTPTPGAILPIPTPIVENSLVVVDDSNSSQDLTGATDFDPVNDRNISLAWNANNIEATDWHVYVREGLGGVRFLGRTADGEINNFNWNDSADNPIDTAFANGPDFNSVYTFRVIRIDDSLGPDDFFDLKGAIGYNLEGGNPVSISLPENPQIEVGKVVIYDDILGGDNLVPKDGTGSDVDSEASRAIQLAWNFGVDPSTVNEYHVFVSVNGNDFEFLGQTQSSATNYFWWTPNNEFRTASAYRNGPEGDNSYQFQIVLVPITGDVQTLTTGVLDYSVN